MKPEHRYTSISQAPLDVVRKYSHTGLWKIDDGCAKEGTENAALFATLVLICVQIRPDKAYIGNGEGATSHILDCQFVVACLSR